MKLSGQHHVPAVSLPNITPIPIE